MILYIWGGPKFEVTRLADFISLYYIYYMCIDYQCLQAVQSSYAFKQCNSEYNAWDLEPLLLFTSYRSPVFKIKSNFDSYLQQYADDTVDSKQLILLSLCLFLSPVHLNLQNFMGKPHKTDIPAWPKLFTRQRLTLVFDMDFLFPYILELASHSLQYMTDIDRQYG